MIGFNNWTITQDEYDWLVSFCRRKGVSNVLEFGTGISTKAFLEAGCNVFTFETNAEYLETLKPELNSIAKDHGKNVIYSAYDENAWLSNLDPGRLPLCDFVFVDGPMGKVWTPSRINTAMFACANFPMIGFHDTNRDREAFTVNLFLSMGFKVVDEFKKELGITIIKPPSGP